MLCISLASLVVGLLALGMARDLPMMLLCAAGVGIGYGLTLFAAACAADYFGRAALRFFHRQFDFHRRSGGADLAGLTRDETGGFMPFLVVLALLVALVLLAVMTMKPPAQETGMSGRKEYGVFLPVANGGWIVSKATPPLDGGWEQNRDAALIAEEEGLRLCDGDGQVAWLRRRDVPLQGSSLEAVTMMAGIAAVSQAGQGVGHAACHPASTAVAAKMIATLGPSSPAAGRG